MSVIIIIDKGILNFDDFTLLPYSTLGPMKCAKPNGDICHIYVLTKPTSLEFFLVLASYSKIILHGDLI